jgi:hypothetical protein
MVSMMYGQAYDEVGDQVAWSDWLAVPDDCLPCDIDQVWIDLRGFSPNLIDDCNHERLSLGSGWRSSGSVGAACGGTALPNAARFVNGSRCSGGLTWGTASGIRLYIHNATSGNIARTFTLEDAGDYELTINTRRHTGDPSEIRVQLLQGPTTGVVIPYTPVTTAVEGTTITAIMENLPAGTYCMYFNVNAWSNQMLRNALLKKL